MSQLRGTGTIPWGAFGDGGRGGGESFKTSRVLGDWRGDRPETPVTLEDPHLQGLTLSPNQTPSLPLCPLPLFIFDHLSFTKVKKGCVWDRGGREGVSLWGTGGKKMGGKRLGSGESLGIPESNELLRAPIPSPCPMLQAQPSGSFWAAGRGIRMVPWVAPGILDPLLRRSAGRALGRCAGPSQARVEDMASADEGC